MNLKDRVITIKRVPHQLMPDVASFAKIGIIPGNNRLSRFYSLTNKLLESIIIETFWSIWKKI